MQALSSILTILKHPSLLGWTRALHLPSLGEGQGVGFLPSLTGGVRGWVFSFLFLLSFSLASCDRYDVEGYYKGTARVRINVDWKKLSSLDPSGKDPSGMTIMLAKDGDVITFTDISNHVKYYDVDLEPGEYKMIIFNLTTSGFGSMRFFQTKSFDKAFSFANDLGRTTDFWDVNASYMRDPELIGCAVDTITITSEMVDEEFRFVDWKEWKERMDDEEISDKVTIFNEVVEPMTTDLYVTVKIIGFKYMAGVVGNISGMADGFILSQAWRRQQIGYQLLDGWTAKASPTESDDTKSVGYITTKISTFGLMHGKELLSQRKPNDNTLSLCFTLIDGTKHVFRYPVGDKLKYPDAEKTGVFSKVDVTLDLNLEIIAPFYADDEVPNLPYAQPSGSGAFDAEVADWGDEEIVDVPM